MNIFDDEVNQHYGFSSMCYSMVHIFSFKFPNSLNSVWLNFIVSTILNANNA